MAAADPDATITPLNPAEDAAWRALARAIVAVPRVLEAELLAAHGMNMAEYKVLVELSESPERAIRMKELADRGALSLSGMTRVVERLLRKGFVERIRCNDDGRGYLAKLTDQGLAGLEQAYPRHLRGVREHVIAHLDGIDLLAFAHAVGAMAPDVTPHHR